VASLRRRTAVPVGVRSALTLERGERVLAAAQLQDRRWVVASTRALHVAPEGAAAGERHGWDQVAAAVWSDTATMLQVTWVGERTQSLLEFGSSEGAAGFLPEVIRERVGASVVLSRRIAVTGRRGVRIAIRRTAPGAELTTQIVPDRGVDLTDPELAARVDAVIADLREQTGMRG
jgi:hypothetical protein